MKVNMFINGDDGEVANLSLREILGKERYENITIRNQLSTSRNKNSRSLKSTQSSKSKEEPSPYAMIQVANK
jgi:hypothetical protein